MASAPNKTQATTASVDEFIAAVPDPRKREDAQTLVKLLRRITGQPPVMWGPSIIGFGSYHYKYASGREGDMAAAGFSPRKDSLVLYLDAGTLGQQDLLDRLGPCRTGKCCLYLRRLAEVDLKVLERMLRSSYEYVMAELHAPSSKR